MRFIRSHKRYFICLILIICAFIGFFVRGRLINSISMQKPDKRWSADGEPFSYVTVYIPATEGFTSDRIRSMRSDLTTALKDASIEQKENARQFIDAYSLETAAEVTKDRNARSPVKVNMTVVGGDYFFFHPFTLLSGNYLSEDLMDDNMADKVVLDEYTAWMLYGGLDVAGKTAIIEGKSFVIAGVVKKDSGKAAMKTYGSKSRIYMTIDGYEKLRGGSSGGMGTGELPYDPAGLAITSYEIVYPDPITNFAYNQVKKQFGLEDSQSLTGDEEETDIEVINFSTRFRYTKLWKVLREYGSRTSKTNGIIYPFWENECRRIEDFAIIWQLAATIFAAAAAVTLFPDIKHLYVFIVSSIQNFIASKRSHYP